MIRRNEVALATAAAALLLLAGCTAKSANQPAQPPPPPDVRVTTVVQKDVPVYGDWVATLDGYVNANIQPQVSGYLVAQNYREGAVVHRGEVLFEIDPRPFKAALDQAKGQLAQARGQLAQAQAQLGLTQINVKRDTPLASARAIAQSQLDNDTQAAAQAEAQVKTGDASIQSAEAMVEQAELNLEFTKVRSLVDGIAGIAATQIGNLVSQTTVLTTVSQVDPIKAYFPISEQEYMALARRAKGGSVPDLLRENVPLALTLANGAEYPRKGKIIFADREVQSQTGTIRIAGSFANPGNVLRPGQFGRIRALLSIHKNALLVPQRAVTELQGRYQVAVVGSDNKVSIRTVQPGDRIGSTWVINSGLNPGERVVTEGNIKAQAGAQVTPKPDTQAATE